MRTVLEAIKDYQHICWYPSAGNDFRPLLFLSEWYYEKHEVPRDEDQVLPDLFIMTDFAGLHEWRADVIYPEEAYRDFEQGICPPGTRLVEAFYRNTHTFVTAKRFEKLSDMTLSYDPKLINLEPSSEYNSVCLMEVEVESRKYGVTQTFEASVLYVTCQNEAFANEFLIPNKVKAEYQVLVRYGYGYGGANEHPEWIIRSYKELGIKYLISNEEYLWEAVHGKHADGRTPGYDEIYSIAGGQWSNIGKVGWYKLS